MQKSTFAFRSPYVASKPMHSDSTERLPVRGRLLARGTQASAGRYWFRAPRSKYESELSGLSLYVARKSKWDIVSRLLISATETSF
ncbi:TPA: hypothetical protein DIS55_00085 [Candidatus Kaiserbacteria bacterium]|uniref:Uncharacterized protein n=4 Tax=Candidatus Kaiseribacteriota TaxID=1752734 RepID=A0A1F6FR49_9BACT|nr:MAG: hypothetical protein A3H15_00465 [Candidatus Kaiserbacteria bacterium RIFCSPLOWO2_12_FULL_50_28]HCM43344.1 hypothetical protein [Candidatus Kaiserbacteria bacterium]